MRIKKEKEKSSTLSNRHSTAALYEIPAQSTMLQDHSDDYILELFEQMLVRRFYLSQNLFRLSPILDKTTLELKPYHI